MGADADNDSAVIADADDIAVVAAAAAVVVDDGGDVAEKDDTLAPFGVALVLDVVLFLGVVALAALVAVPHDVGVGSTRCSW